MFERAIANLRPRPRTRLVDWARVNVQTHEGRPYDHTAYPHLGAPGGPMDAFDYHGYLAIWLQWASRLGKTFFGQVATMKQADCDPCPMMFASSDAKLAKEVVARTYRMLGNCPPLRVQLRPPHRQRQDLVELAACRMYVSWARSVSTLADKAVRVGHANEIDKWEHQSTSKEADPLKLFSDRFKEFPSHKKIYESTPALKSASRIERGRLAGTNCSYYVPCPKCWRYQVLDMKRIEWDKNEAGKSDKDLARRTARYECLHCEAELRDEHRGPMMRAGVWAPEGCGIDDAKARAVAAMTDRKPFAGWSLADWVTGTPLRDGRDASYQLSSLYALSLSWGDIAAEWVDCQRNPQNLRNFINQWLGETWEIVSRKTTWELLGQKIIDKEITFGVVPKWGSIATVGIDRQADDRHPWVVDAWGPDRSATIAYGEAESIEQLEQQLSAAWPHADNGPPVLPSMILMDSGHRPLGVHELCERWQAAGIPALPCKGSNKALASDYQVVTLGDNTSRPGAALCHVDTIRSQTWIERAIHDADPRGQSGFSLCAGNLWEHQDFLQQLLNDAPIEDVDSHNNARESWDRIDPNVPNDFRDCKRYAWVGMLLASRNAPIHPRRYSPPIEQAAGPSRIRELRIRR